MYILGITAPISWNNAACIIKDGELIAAAEEERFTRLKHAPRTPPVKAVEFCLKYAGIQMAQVDYIAVGFGSPAYYAVKNFLSETQKLRFVNYCQQFGSYAEYLIQMYKLMVEFTRMDKKIKNKKWVYVPHHIAHAASAFYMSGFDTANIITLDGNGEDDSGLIGIGGKGKIKKLKKIDLYHSSGMIYSSITDILGFVRHSQEGKTMGLAAYGRIISEFEKNIISFDEKTIYKLRPFYEKYIWKNYGPRRGKDEDLSEFHKNLAASAQDVIEKVGVAAANYAYKQTAVNNFCLAGGVVLNCDMNAKIAALPFVNEIFTQPAAHDGGCALGAAFEVYSRLGGRQKFKMEHAYWGSEYGENEIEAALRQYKLRYKKCENIENTAADLLAQGKIIGWFQGRMELGPRALGNRSILAHPGKEHMKDKVNKEVKHREMWRPFAPSILEEDAADYVENYRPSPFMLLTFKVKSDKIKDLAQAAHVDNTARLQTVSKKTNPRFHKLITCFKQKTGIPALLNTSYNDRGEPIVESPKDAIRTFFSTGLDYLALGDYLIGKE